MSTELRLLPLLVIFVVTSIPQRYYDQAALVIIKVMARYLARRGLVKIDHVPTKGEQP